MDIKCESNSIRYRCERSINRFNEASDLLFVLFGSTGFKGGGGAEDGGQHPVRYDISKNRYVDVWTLPIRYPTVLPEECHFGRLRYDISPDTRNGKYRPQALFTVPARGVDLFGAHPQKYKNTKGRRSAIYSSVWEKLEAMRILPCLTLASKLPALPSEHISYTKQQQLGLLHVADAVVGSFFSSTLCV